MMRIETALHSIQTVTKQYIETRGPASNALDLVKMLPSVSVGGSDPSGMNGGSIESRSLTDADMSLMVDDAPALSAQHIADDVDMENIESISVTPGSSAIQLPSTTAAAGVMNQKTIRPADIYGGSVDFSYGTNNLSREFIRLQSGNIGKSGVRSYLSFSNIHARPWMGAGFNQKRHSDFGIEKVFSNGSYAKLFASWTGVDYSVDAYPTQAQFLEYKHTGNGYNRSSEYNKNSPSNNYWKDNIDHWNQVFLSSQFHAVANKNLDFDVLPYFQWGTGWYSYSGGVNSYTNGVSKYYNGAGESLSNGAHLTSYFNEHYSESVGVTVKGNYHITNRDKVSFGYWYEYAVANYSSPISQTLEDGSGPNPNNSLYYVYTKSTSGKLSRVTPLVDAGSENHALFIDYTGKRFNDKLEVNAGFKFDMGNLWENKSSNTHLGENTVAPLPHLSAGYRISDQDQIYFNAEGDFRQPSVSSLAVNPSSKSLPKNQYIIKEEVGFRHHDDIFIADISLFNYNITNRLLPIYVGGGQTSVVNSGNQTARGVDVMLSTHPFHGFSPYLSVEYLDATMDSNVMATADNGSISYMRTKGKRAVMAPKVMANFGLTYENKGFFSNVGVHYTGAQTVTIAGDERMPGYVTDTLSFGYHFKPISYARSPTFRLNFSNLTGSIVRNGVKGVGTNLHAITLMNGSTLSSGSSASFYVEPRFSMTGTISTDF